MTHTMEVQVDATGRICPTNPEAKVPEGPALLLWRTGPDLETMLLSEPSLAENWLGAEEDAAWAHLQPDK